MKELVRLIGGSHLYGLNTATSDEDVRGVFIHTDVNRLFSYNRQDIVLSVKSDDEDSQFMEIRHFIYLLSRTNTQVMEIMFADNFIVLDDKFKSLIMGNWARLIDSDHMYKALQAYIRSERELAFGIRQSNMGKRKEAVEKYGFSLKNLSHLLRLAKTGVEFYKSGCTNYIINFKKAGLTAFHDRLLDIKLNPEKQDKEKLVVEAAAAQVELHAAYTACTAKLVFDKELANQIILEFYYPVVKEAYERSKKTD